VVVVVPDGLPPPSGVVAGVDVVSVPVPVPAWSHIGVWSHEGVVVVSVWSVLGVVGGAGRAGPPLPPSVAD
jgi:hypothetical protein